MLLRKFSDKNLYHYYYYYYYYYYINDNDNYNLYLMYIKSARKYSKHL